MRNTWVSSAVFVLAFLVSVGVAMWINNPVLCLGDPSFSDGCGGFTLYFPLWVLFYSPLIATALILVRPRMLFAYRVRGLLLSIYLALIVLALEVSFVNDIGLSVLLAEWVLLGVLFAFLRSLMVSLSRKDERRW